MLIFPTYSYWELEYLSQGAYHVMCSLFNVEPIFSSFQPVSGLKIISVLLSHRFSSLFYFPMGTLVDIWS